MRAGRRPLLAAALGGVAVPAAAAPGFERYERPELLGQIPFGAHSHWLQPWRVSAETIPASVLARGVGMNGADGIEPARMREALAMLAAHGIGTVRIEIPWAAVDYATERFLTTEDRLRPLLQACRAAAIRPLVLLNAHHGVPGPMQVAEGRVAADAPRGARAVELHAAGAVHPGRTGLSDLTDYIAAEVLVTRVEGTRHLLSKPLPRALRAGERVKLATLRYEPFSAPGSPRNQATMAGWLRYLDLVADTVGTMLETRPGEDRGFDLELWNELTFGSRFLSINNYYQPRPVAYDEDSIWDEIVARSAAHVAAQPRRYAGAAISNGFAATIPWPAASRQPERIVALSKRAYPPLRRYPEDEAGGTALGADARPARFVPAYRSFFPEYGATALQTETLMRDIAAQPNPLHGALHGRMARMIDGRPAPVAVWLTEVGVNPPEFGVDDPRAAERLKAKCCLRAVVFYLGIGVGRVYWFRAFGDTRDYALMPASRPDSPTLPLAVLSRALGCIRGPGGARPPGDLRRLEFEIAAGAEGPPVFEGDGGPGSPALRSLDCLALLPFQSAPGRLVVAYYVMTRDIRATMAPEEFRVRIAGIRGPAARLRAFDPMTNRDLPVAALDHAADRLTVGLAAGDTPRLLVIEDAAA